MSELRKVGAIWRPKREGSQALGTGAVTIGSQRQRVKGRGALVRSLTGLLLRVTRYAEHRARTQAEIMWAARLAAHLSVAPSEARGLDPGASAATFGKDFGITTARPMA